MKQFATRINARPRRLALLSLIVMAAASAAGTAPSAEQATDRAIESASARGLDWLESHRASPEDGGLTDMIDEGVSLQVFQDLARTAPQRERFARAFADHMTALNRVPEFERWVSRPYKPLIEHYHLVLAAHLTELAGQTSPLIPRIKRQAQRALTAASHENPTVRLTTALFVARLADPPAIDIAALLDASLIARLGHDRHFITLPGADATAQQRRTATWLLYALVHEVVALTDFGRVAAPPWLVARSDAVREILLDALTWAGAQANRDLAAELVITLYLLGQPLNAPLRAALNDLLANQQADGSWGVSADTGRSNKVRHTVLTGTAALMAWLAWRQAP